MKRRLLALIAIALLAACKDRPLAFVCSNFEDFRIPVSATPREPGRGSVAGRRDPLVGVAGRRDLLVNAIAGAFESRTAADGAPSPANVLILSGGGQWGAFGAGFLHGWSSMGTGAAARPQSFDVVTGVSTGSLQATFAFLGSSADGGLLNAYTIASERQLVRRHGGLFFLFHGSMADIAPLEAYVRERLRGLMDQVAAQDERRKLLVGVVDALDGQMYAIDLTRIARERSGTERENCYAAALLASSAVPVVFRQVTINGRPYFDGGVRQSVFATGIQDAAGLALARNDRPGSVYVLMNGETAARRVDAVPAMIVPTLGRLRELVFNQIDLSSIYSVAERFPAMTTYIATAADHDCSAPSDEESEIFNPATMRCLRDYGEERWREGNPWIEYPRPGP